MGKHDRKEDCEGFIYLAKDQGRELLNAFKDKNIAEHRVNDLI